MAVANGTVSWQPNQLLRKFEADLSILPAYFARKYDVVITEKKPAKEFFQNFENLDFDFPELLSFERLVGEIEEKGMYPSKVKPWGWSRSVHHKFRGIIPYCSKAFQDGPFKEWNPELKYFYSREFALNVFQKTLENSAEDSLPDRSALPEKCMGLEEIRKAHKKNLQSVVKMPWSASGRGVQLIDREGIHPSIEKWLLGGLKQQGFLMVEKFLDKKLDFANHFEIRNKKVLYLGYSIFDTSIDGKYKGNYLKHYVPGVLRGYMGYLEDKVAKTVTVLKKVLEASALTDIYEGYLGIDGLVFADDSHLKIHPCIEINLRYNMGLLAFKLEKMLAGNSYGIFQQFGGKPGEFSKLIRNKQKKNPLSYVSGKVLNGVLPLTGFEGKEHFGAYLEVFTR